MRKWLTARPSFFLYLFLAWLLAITALSLAPDLGEVPEEVRIPNLDKAAHFSFYLGFMVLGALWQVSDCPVLRADGEQKPAYLRVIAVLFVVAGVYGTVIEGLQSWLTTTRQLEVADMLANLAGAFAGSLVSYASFRRYQTLINRLSVIGIKRKY